MGNRRIWWGLAIMVAGLCAAWPFRRALVDQEPSPEEPIARSVPLRPPGPTVLAQAASRPEEPSPASDAPDRENMADPLRRPAGWRRPKPTASHLENLAAAPSLSSRFQLPADENVAAGQASNATLGPDPRSAVLRDASTSPSVVTPPPMLRTYRIRRHDTLAEIAERFLGSRDEAGKILALNQGVIPAPEILPIGATILIPDAGSDVEPLVRLPEENE